MDSELIVWRQQAVRLADVRLMTELQQLVQVDRSCEAHLLVLLAEVDARQLYLAQGYSSLFRYAVSALRMSEAQAYLRIRAARVARVYPVALEMLVEGATYGITNLAYRGTVVDLSMRVLPGGQLSIDVAYRRGARGRKKLTGPNGAVYHVEVG